MAFIDSEAALSAGPNVPKGAGTQGVKASASAVVNTPPGAQGMASGLSVKTWVFIFYAFIAVVLGLSGYLFNGKKRG